MEEIGHTGRTFVILGMKSSAKELIDLLKAWLAVSVAFAIVFKDPGNTWLTALLLAAFAVGMGFLVHELCHKLLAQKYRLWAEFRSFDVMLVFAIVTAFFGFPFAAPGAVMLRGTISQDRQGKVALVGPLSNLALAAVFLIAVVLSTGMIATACMMGFFVNSWLGLLNTFPLPSFDGYKIMQWNKLVFAAMLIVGFAFMFLSYALISY